MSVTLTVAVVVSIGRHPISGAARACPGDAVAMAVAQKLAGGATRVVHAGNSDQNALRDYLALGASRVETLHLGNSHDAVVALSDYLRSIDIIVTGSRSEAGHGSGLLPYQLAAILKRPVVANVLSAVADGSSLTLQQFLPKGQRRSVVAPTPVVLAVHPRADTDLKYAYARRMAGRIDVIVPQSKQPSAVSQVWTVDATACHPQRLHAADQRNGHQRLQKLIKTPARGGAVAFEGTSVDKAQILLTYLRDNRILEL